MAGPIVWPRVFSASSVRRGETLSGALGAYLGRARTIGVLTPEASSVWLVDPSQHYFVMTRYDTIIMDVQDFSSIVLRAKTELEQGTRLSVATVLAWQLAFLLDCDRVRLVDYRSVYGVQARREVIRHVDQRMDALCRSSMIWDDETQGVVAAYRAWLSYQRPDSREILCGLLGDATEAEVLRSTRAEAEQDTERFGRAGCDRDWARSYFRRLLLRMLAADHIAGVAAPHGSGRTAEVLDGEQYRIAASLFGGERTAATPAADPISLLRTNLYALAPPAGDLGFEEGLLRLGEVLESDVRVSLAHWAAFISDPTLYADALHLGRNELRADVAKLEEGCPTLSLVEVVRAVSGGVGAVTIGTRVAGVAGGCVAGGVWAAAHILDKLRKQPAFAQTRPLAQAVFIAKRLARRVGPDDSFADYLRHLADPVEGDLARRAELRSMRSWLVQGWYEVERPSASEFYAMKSLR